MRSKTDEKRESGIELAKIIAMFMIVVSHVIESIYLYNNNPINLNLASNNIQIISLQTFKTLFSGG